jgi:hypothetical protein
MRSMRFTLAFVLVLLALAYIGFGCKASPSGASVPDWQKLDLIGDEAISAVDGQAAVWAHKPEYVAFLSQARGALVSVDTAIHKVATGAAEPESLTDVIELATGILDAQIAAADPAKQDLVAVLVSLRLVLGVIRVASM